MTINMANEIYLLLLFAVSLTGVTGSTLDDVQEVVNIVRSLRGTTYTTVSEVQKTSAKSYDLLSKSAQIGHLISTGMEQEFSPGSEMQKAIEFVNSGLVEQLRGIETKEIQLENLLSDNEVEQHYEETVSKYMGKLLVLLQQVTNPEKVKRQAHKLQFESACTDIMQNPYNLLTIMDDLYRRNCPIPSAESTQEYVSILRALREFGSREGNDLPSSLTFVEAKRKLLSRFASLDKNSTLSEIERAYFNSTEAKQDAIALIRNIAEQSSGRRMNDLCLLQTIFDETGHELEMIIGAVEQLRLHTIQAQVLIMACRSDNSTIEIEVVKNSTSKVQTLLNSVVMWIENAQQLSYPTVTIEKAKQALDESEEKSYKACSKIVQSEFRRRGRETDNFQVLSTEGLAWSEFTVRSLDEDDRTLFNHNFKRFFVFRYDMPISTRMPNVLSWFEEHKDEILTILESEKDNDQISKVMDVLQRKLGIISDSRFHGAVLMRKETIDMGVAYNTIFNQNNTQEVVFMEGSYHSHLQLFV